MALHDTTVGAGPCKSARRQTPDRLPTRTLLDALQAAIGPDNLPPCRGRPWVPIRGLTACRFTVPLTIVMAVADHACATAVEADNAIRPAELTNDFIALRFVEQIRQLDQVHHGSRSLLQRERPTDQLPDQDQYAEILTRPGGSLPDRFPSPWNPTRANRTAGRPRAP